MKRLVLLGVCAFVLSGCARVWVGRPVTQLRKEMGLPQSIRVRGTDQIYVYPDTLAGRGEMTFTVDKDGIIRDWYATPRVPGPFGSDIFGSDNADGFDVNGNPVGPGPNGGFGPSFP